MLEGHPQKTESGLTANTHEPEPAAGHDRQRQGIDQLRELLDAAGDLAHVGVWDLDVNSQQVVWTKAVYDIHELPYDTPIDLQSALSYYDPNSHQILAEAIDRAIRSGEPWSLEHGMMTASGARRWVRTNGKAIWHEGKVVRLFGAIQDITNQKRAERALRQSENMLSSLLASAPVGIFMMKDGHFTWTNQRFCTMVGHAPESLLGRRVDAIYVTNEEFVEIHRALRAGIERRGKSKTETQFKHGRGHEFDVIISAAPRDPQDLTGGVICCALDITEQKRSERALRASEQRYRLIVETANEGIIMLGPDSRVTFVNPKMADMLGYQPGQLIGLAHRDLIVSTDDDSGVKLDEPADHAKACSFEQMLRHRDGHARCFQVSSQPVRGARHEILGSFAMLTDITDRKRIEEELSAYRNHLEEMVRVRTEELQLTRERMRQADRLASIGTLAAGIAHEINNPLGTIMLSADAALDSQDEPEAQVEFLHGIKQDVERCSRIVQGVLRFARRHHAEKDEVDLADVVRASAALLRKRAAEQEVGLRIKIEDDPVLLQANGGELEQTCLNLMQNALGACRAGDHITIKCQKDEETHHGIIIVSDTGCGMTPEQQRQAFDPFFTTKHQQGGVGLGLSIVHGIINDHGGAISVDSRPGCGTVFTVSLPL